MKKSLGLVLLLMLACALALSACDNGTEQPQKPDTEQSTNLPTDDNYGESSKTDDTQTPSTDNTECQHTFGEWITITESTCKEDGEAKRICSKCSAEDKKSIDKTNNHIEVVDSAVAPTCTTTGLTAGKHCSVCNTIITAQTTISALEHTVVVDAATESTCKTNGKTDGKHCSVCDFVILEQTTLPLASHTYDNDEDEKCNVCDFVRDVNCKHTETITLQAISPTCIAGGLTEGKKCTKCEETLVAQTIVGALGHVEVIDNAVAATCTTDGKTEGKHCSRCNTTLVAQMTIRAKDHADSNSICSVCGYNMLEYAGGTGTEKSPYLIATVEHMRNLGKYQNAYYQMISDIDFREEAYSCCSKFTGVFDGNNHKIFNLYAFDAAIANNNYGTIKNVCVVDSNISRTDNQISYCGAIVAQNYGSIINCHNVNTRILAETNHDTWQKHSYAGGIAGRNMDNGIISKCSNTGYISAVAKGTYSNTAFWSYAGGIVGMNYNASISDCYNIGQISASSYTTKDCSTVSLRRFSGGIAGGNVESSSIVRTYNASPSCTYGIACNDKDTGYYFNGTIKNSYYAFSSYGGTGATRVSFTLLEKQETFVGFDFDGIWMMGVINDSMCPIFKVGCKEHTIVKDNAIEATCISGGRIEGSHCSLCLVVIEPFFTTPSLGHSYDNEHICTRCQVKDSVSGVVYQLNDNKTEYTVIRIDNKNVSIIEIYDMINNCPVTTISANVFSRCEKLETIILPNHLTSIGQRAFEYCVNLKNISIPSTVVSIGAEAFYSCDSLTSINIPRGITVIREKTFGGCENLKNIQLCEGLTTIEEYAFGWCCALLVIDIPNTVIQIEENAFYACTYLKTVVIPSQINNLYNVFYGCDNIDYYFRGSTVPEGLTLHSYTKCFYYSDMNPTDESKKYWHYVDNIPTPWE